MHINTFGFETHQTSWLEYIGECSAETRGYKPDVRSMKGVAKHREGLTSDDSNDAIAWVLEQKVLLRICDCHSSDWQQIWAAKGRSCYTVGTLQ